MVVSPIPIIPLGLKVMTGRPFDIYVCLHFNKKGFEYL